MMSKLRRTLGSLRPPHRTSGTEKIGKTTYDIWSDGSLRHQLKKTRGKSARRRAKKTGGSVWSLR